MPVPALEDGLLPVGTHDATLPEIRGTFGSANAKRIELMDRLEALAAFAAPLGFFRWLYVDGSFCTDKELPSDVDVVFEAKARATLVEILKSPDGRLLALDRPACMTRWLADVFVQAPAPTQPDWVTFFTRIKQEEILARRITAGHRRGILRVAL